MLVASLQFKPLRGKVAQNRARIGELATLAAQRGAELIVFPEMCTSGYVFPSRDLILPYCEARNGESVMFLSGLADSLGATIVFGWPESVANGAQLFNSAAVCRPGHEVLFYRKNLLYEADESWALPGDTPYPVWTSESGYRCSLGICMDLNDDNFVAHLVEQDIRVCAFPTNWLSQGIRVWDYWAWRIRDTQTCLVAANTFGREDDTVFCGESAILDGRIILSYGPVEGDNLLMARIPIRPTEFENLEAP